MSHHPHCDCGGCLQSAKLWAAVRANAPKPKVRSRFWGLFVYATGLLTIVAASVAVAGAMDGVTVLPVVRFAIGFVAGYAAMVAGRALFTGQA